MEHALVPLPDALWRWACGCATSDYARCLRGTMSV